MLQRNETTSSGQIVIDPGVSVAWAREGIALAKEGDLPGALGCLRVALAIDDDCYEGWLGLTKVFGEMKENARAERCRSIARSLRGRLGVHDPDTATA